MSLTPKNWTDFQHYKNRSPIWIKLHRKLLDDFVFSRLPVASRALAPLLWLLASEYEDGKITATNEELAFRLRMSEDDFDDAVKPLIDSGFFASDSVTLARRKRVAIPEREKETQVEKEIEKNTRAVANATRPDDPFEIFKKSYPKRKGANPWPPARNLFSAALKSGADPNQIIGAVRAGVGFDRDKIGTEYIPQAVKWLRDRRWEDHQTSTAAPMTAPVGAPSDAELRAKYGKQHHAVSTEAGAGQANGTAADHPPELRSEGTGIRSNIGPSGIPHDHARHAGMQRLGAVLPQPPGRCAIGVPDADVPPNSGDDGPDAVARVV